MIHEVAIPESWAAAEDKPVKDSGAPDEASLQS